MKTGLIYIATNKINDKSYIGLTTKSLELRARLHYNESKNKMYKFANALKKYNKSDWGWKILHDNIPYKYLSDMEVFYIFIFDTYNNGYNSTEGGEISPMVYPEIALKVSKKMSGKNNPMYGKSGELNPMYGKKFSDDHLRKLSESHTGNKHSEETKKKISKNSARHFLGKKFSEEHKAKLKEAWKRRKLRNKI